MLAWLLNSECELPNYKCELWVSELLGPLVSRWSTQPSCGLLMLSEPRCKWLLSCLGRNIFVWGDCFFKTGGILTACQILCTSVVQDAAVRFSLSFEEYFVFVCIYVNVLLYNHHSHWCSAFYLPREFGHFQANASLALEKQHLPISITSRPTQTALW